MATWLNPRNGVIHAVAPDGSKTACGCVRLWATRGRIDPSGRLTEEYLEEVKQEFGGPWSLCCHCQNRVAEDRMDMIDRIGGSTTAMGEPAVIQRKAHGWIGTA